MAVKAGASSLAEIVRALSAMVGAELAIDNAQERCVIESLRNYFKLDLDQRHEIYPAIASSNRLLDGTGESQEKVFRHGIVVKTTDTGEWYYIGGVSGYWDSGHLIIYQAGVKFASYGVLSKRVFDGIVKKAGGIGVIPVRNEMTVFTMSSEDPTVLKTLHNPPIFADCGGGSGTFWNLLGGNNVEVQAMPSQAWSLSFHFGSSVHPITHVGKDGGTYLSSRAKEIMSSASYTYPFIYLGIGTNRTPLSAMAGLVSLPVTPYPFYTVNGLPSEYQSICDTIMPEDVCYWTSRLPQFSDVYIGVPVFSTMLCGPNCSRFGLVGLVAGYSQLALGSIDAIQAIVIPLPSSFTSSTIMEYAKSLKIDNELNALLEGKNKFMKAVRELSKDFLSFIATTAAQVVDWSTTNYEEGLSLARRRAQELYDMYTKIIDEVIEDQPPITDLHFYSDWLTRKEEILDCTQRAILNNPEITYEELESEVSRCA